MQIITREQWGARYSDGYEQYGHRAVGDLSRYLHHTVTRHLPEDASVAYEVSQMRAIEAIGQQRFGNGISYTFLIFPSGRVYEGASITRISAHTGKGRNTTGAGLCLAGNYETHPLGVKAERALVDLLVWGVGHWWKSPTITAAHRDIKSTSCPGWHAYTRIGAVDLAGLRLVEVGSRDEIRDPLPTWRPAVLPELINARLRLAGFPTGGRPGDYDKSAVARYQGAQLFPGLEPDGLWGPVTESHFTWTVELQSALERVGGRLAKDGSYGPHTAFTVGRYQATHGLFVDEKAGPVTCARLGIRSHR